MKRSVGLLFLVLAMTSAYGATDKVVFDRVNTMIGEVKRMQRGKLHFKTTATDTITVDWLHVDQLVARKRLQVEMASGERVLGTLRASSTDGTLHVRLGGKEREIPMKDVVAITEIESTWRERLDVTLSAGYNFTNATKVEQANFGIRATYNTERHRNSFTADLTQTDDSASERTIRFSVQGQVLRLLNDRYVRGGAIQFERNDAQGLELRTSFAYGYGRYMRRSNFNNLLLLGGLSASQEESRGTSDTQQNLEAFGSAVYELFRFDDPEIDLTTTLTVLPSLTQAGRVRANFDITLRWELVEDLFWELQFYDTYDSDPVTEGADKNDYGIVTGISFDL